MQFHSKPGSRIGSGLTQKEIVVDPIINGVAIDNSGSQGFGEDGVYVLEEVVFGLY